MEIRKIYDELYGMIEDLKRKVAGISSGDAVTITPALENGAKVADYTIGETEGSLYAPDAADMFCGIDTSNLIYSDTTTTFTDPVTYTAVGKCFADIIAKGSSNTVQSVSINGVVVSYFGASLSNVIIPLVAGDVITSRLDSNVEECDARLYIYGIRNEIPPSPEPENNTKKRRK